MGDNRDNSLDSRVEHVGYVPLENLIGRAEFLFFSVNGSRHLSSPGPGRGRSATSRIFTSSTRRAPLAAGAAQRTGRARGGLGHAFADRGLLDEALTHASASGPPRAAAARTTSGWSSWATGCWA